MRAITATIEGQRRTGTPTTFQCYRESRHLNWMVRIHGFVQKKTSDIRLCVDQTKLNDAVRREKLILPVVNETLAMLSDVALFSKLDCSSRFFQIFLTSNCIHLTTFITPFCRSVSKASLLG